MSYVPRLQKLYDEKRVELKSQLVLKNVNQVPRLKKITVNIGQGEAVKNIKVLEAAMRDLEAVTGQKAVMTRAKKSIAGFKLREGMPIGCCVTLRSHKMYEFLDRFINVVGPAIRDFRGYSAKAFDGRGNYSFGVREQIIFPEIEYDKVDRVRGLGVQIETSGRNDLEGKALLELFGFPLKK